MLIGYLGGDPEMKELGSGTPVCNFSIATSESWKDKETQERKERTEWHRVVIYGRLAEIAMQFAHKGTLVYLEGANRTRKWTDKEGKDRYTTEVVGSALQVLSPREGSAGSSGQASSNGEAQQPDQFPPEVGDEPPF